MKQEDIEKMRKENKIILSKMNEELAKRKRYEELLKDPLIEEFLALQDYKSFVPMSEETRIRMLTPIGIKKIDSNGIYVDQGTYIYKKVGTMDVREYMTFPNDKKATYKYYMELETGEYERILMKDVQNFEKENLVILISEEYVGLENNYGDIYYRLRRWFFKELLTRPQHEVVKSLMDKETISKILNETDEVFLERKKN